METRSQTLLHNDQNSNDSDVTYCPEVEEQSQKRIRKKTQFFQAKPDGIRTLEQMTDRTIQRGATKNGKAAKLLKRIKQFKTTNRGDEDVVLQLTEKLQNFEIANSQKSKYNCDQNADVSEVTQNLNDPTTSTQSPLRNHFDANEVISDINIEHNYSKVGTKEIINLDNLEELKSTYNIVTNDILNCLNYESSPEINQHTGDSQTNYDAAQVFPGSCVDESLTRMAFDTNIGTSQTNKLLNNNCDTSQTMQSIYIYESLNGVKGFPKHNSNTISNNSFENFAKEHLSEGNEITVQSDVKLNQLEPYQKQQLIDKCLPQTHIIEDFKFSASTQTNETFINKRAISKRVWKKKPARKRNKKRTTQNNTQSTIIIDDYFGQNNNEKETQVIEEEVSADTMSPKEKKNKKLQLSLQRAVELLEISKQKFKLLLQAKKEDILKSRNAQSSCVKKGEASNSCNFSADSNKMGFQVDNSNLITKEEMLRNMRVLHEISAHYKKKYKSEGIDLLND